MGTAPKCRLSKNRNRSAGLRPSLNPSSHSNARLACALECDLGLRLGPRPALRLRFFCWVGILAQSPGNIYLLTSDSVKLNRQNCRPQRTERRGAVLPPVGENWIRRRRNASAGHHHWHPHHYHHHQQQQQWDECDDELVEAAVCADRQSVGRFSSATTRNNPVRQQHERCSK